jgi:hypothetical protein
VTPLTGGLPTVPDGPDTGSQGHDRSRPETDGDTPVVSGLADRKDTTDSWTRYKRTPTPRQPSARSVEHGPQPAQPGSRATSPPQTTATVPATSGPRSGWCLPDAQSVRQGQRSDLARPRLPPATTGGTTPLPAPVDRPRPLVLRRPRLAPRPPQPPLRAGFTEEHTRRVADCLMARHFLVIDEETEEVLIRSWARFDEVLKQPRLAISYVNAYNAPTPHPPRGHGPRGRSKMRDALARAALLERPAGGSDARATRRSQPRICPPPRPVWGWVAPQFGDGFGLGLPQTSQRFGGRFRYPLQQQLQLQLANKQTSDRLTPIE